MPVGPIQVINQHGDILTSKTIMMKIHRRQLCRGRAIRHCTQESTAPVHQFIALFFVPLKLSVANDSQAFASLTL